MRCFAGVASMLPGLPGLRVKGVGDVSLPLRQENVGPLQAVGQLVRNNVWLLSPTKVEMRNPEWQKGIQKLTQMAAASLGFKDIKLLPVFIMVLVYGPGGRLGKQQVEDPAGRCMATLEVQLPSVYTGGDLIVDDGEPNKTFRLDFGRKAGNAEFRPHYGVYAIGAYRTAEEVISGYRLVAVYSLCLPENIPSFSGSSAINLLRVQLAEAVKKVTTLQGGDKAEDAGGAARSGDSVILALMLSQSTKEQNIKTYGSAALSGVDRDRFDALVAANALLTPGNQLDLYIACLQRAFASIWDTNSACERVSWYSLKGVKLGDSPSSSTNWTTHFRFLNPGKETFAELWNESGVCGYSEHARFAIVGWPVSANITNMLSWMGEDAATAAVLADNPIQPAKLQQLLFSKAARQSKAKELAKKPYGAYEYASTYYGYSPCMCNTQPTLIEPPLALSVCQKICNAITASAKVNLVDVFFKTCFSQVKEKYQLTPSIAALLCSFRWELVRDAVKTAIQQLPVAEGMHFALMLATALHDHPLAPSALTLLAAEIARLWYAVHQQCLPLQDVEALWKNAACCQSPEILRDVGKVFTEIDGKHLLPVVSTLSKFVTVCSPEQQRSVFTSIVSRRREWLQAEISDIVKPFTCQIRDDKFPNAAELIAFFKGPNRSCMIRGFTSIAEARKRVIVLRKSVIASLQVTSEGRGRESLVRITKTAGAFDPRKELLPVYKSEMAQLIQLESSLLPRSHCSTTPFGGIIKKSNKVQVSATLAVRTHNNNGSMGSTSASTTTTMPRLVLPRASDNACSRNVCGDSSIVSRSVEQQTGHGSNLLNACAKSLPNTNRHTNIPLPGSKNTTGDSGQDGATTNASSDHSHGNVQPVDNTKKSFDGEASALSDALQSESKLQAVEEPSKRGKAFGDDTTTSTSSDQRDASTPVKQNAPEDSSEGAFASVGELRADLGHSEKERGGDASDATHDDSPSAAGNASPKTIAEMTSPVSVGRLPSDCSPIAARSRGGNYRSDHLANLSRLLGDVLSMDPANDENAGSNAHVSRASATIGKKRPREEENDVVE